jgi:hypothetical protein
MSSCREGQRRARGMTAAMAKIGNGGTREEDDAR